MKKLKQAVKDTQDTVDEMLEMTGDNNFFLRIQLQGIRINTAATLYMINVAEAAAARAAALKDTAINALCQKLQHKR